MARRTESRWTPDAEQKALERLRREHPTVLIYARQSKSDFNLDGTPRGPSLDQQKADCARLPELAGCPVEPFADADRSGKETFPKDFKDETHLHGLPLTPKRGWYNAMIRRIDAASDGEIGAVVVYEGSRL